MKFNVAAESYDRFMGVWSRQLAPKFADFAQVRPGQRVLDVGCGPGSLTGELIERIGPEWVSAVDPSEPFVAAARARFPTVDVRPAHAEALPYGDHTFDAALAQLVVHFMTEPVAGLREMARVVRPGGVAAACVWDFGGRRGPLGPFWEAVRELDPEVEDEARLAGTRQGHLVEILLAAGLVEVEEGVLEVRRPYGGFEDWWEPFTGGVGPAGAYVARLGPGQQIQLRDRCRSLLPVGGFVLTARAWAARGVV